MSYDLKNIFDEADRLSKCYSDSFVKSIDEWPVGRQISYTQGPIRGMYQEKNPLILNYLNTNIDILEFKNIFKKIVLINNGKNSLFKSSVTNNAIALNAERERTILEAQSKDELKDALYLYNSLLFETVKDEPVDKQLCFVKLLFEYEVYKEIKSKLRRLQNINNEMLENEIELDRYGLIAIEDNKRKLIVNNPPRIYDNRMNKTIIIDCTEEFIRVLSDLYYKEHIIGKMAFKGIKIDHGENDTQIINEEVERGQIFELDIEKLPDITKLYEIDYENQLWVLKNRKEIVFEELNKELMIYGESIVTKMLHLRFDSETNGKETEFVIQHMDFEYIFYRVEEFDERKKTFGIKGTGHKKSKVFKIDDCVIPINYPIEMLNTNLSSISVPFLYFALDAFFERKELLREYFRKIL